MERPGYIVPNRRAAEHTSKSHREWLQTPGRGGRQRVDSSVRKFSDLGDEFLERWDSRGL